jgi:hypothetical protein
MKTYEARYGNFEFSNRLLLNIRNAQINRVTQYYGGEDWQKLKILVDELNSDEEQYAELDVRQDGIYVKWDGSLEFEKVIEYSIAYQVAQSVKLKEKDFLCKPKVEPRIINLDNPEVFAIKGQEAFIGGKIKNGNFWFTSLKITDPAYVPKNSLPLVPSTLRNRPSLAEVMKIFKETSPVLQSTKPDLTEHRARIYATTYQFYLHAPGFGPCFATEYADKAVSKFDKLFP